MARVIDDIVQYFKQKEVDIMGSPHATVLGLCRGEADRIYDAIGRRDYPTGDLIASVIEAEQHIEQLQTEVRMLRADCRALRKGGTQ